jgi:hypothetical protein
MSDRTRAHCQNCGVPWQRWRMGYARSLFGPEATAALDKAGYFRVPLDDVSETG